jgi:hypothetical protein
MKHLAFLLLLSAWFFAPAARAQDAQAPAPETMMLRLRDGSIAWGSITAHDPDGFVFERLDNGGHARLTWSLLHPDEEQDLRRKWGYVDLSGEEVLVDADKIVTVDGQEVVGQIIGSTEDSILVKTASATIPILKNRIASAPQKVRVSAFDVFTRAELYSVRLGNTDPSSTDGEWQLAQYCESISDFAHAAEHYKKIKDLDATFRPEDIKAAIERALDKASHQDQLDYLTEIDVLVVRRKFDDAIVRAEAFATKFPDSALIPQAKRAKDRAIKARDRFLVERVATLWEYRGRQLARTASTKMTFEQALAYLEGQMAKEVLDSVSKEMLKVTKEASPDTVRKMWNVRKKERWLSASYSEGTWLLGKEAALKGAEDEKDKDKQQTAPVTEKDKERAELEKKLKQFLANQEMARKSKTAGDKKEDREGAWKELPPGTRSNWIFAYYAENSGDFEVRPKPTMIGCRECGGKGTRIVALAGGNVSKSMIGKQSTDSVTECPTCHGLGVQRKIAYR